MKELLEFLQNDGIDDQVYIVAPGIKPGHLFELWWKSEREDRPWWFRRRYTGVDNSTNKRELVWETYTLEELHPELLKSDVNMPSMAQQLTNIAMNQVAYAHTLERRARKLFGHDKVNHSLREQRVLSGLLSNELKHGYMPSDALRFKSQQRPSKTYVIKGGGQSTPKSHGHLRVVPRVIPKPAFSC